MVTWSLLQDIFIAFKVTSHPQHVSGQWRADLSGSSSCKTPQILGWICIMESLGVTPLGPICVSAD